MHKTGMTRGAAAGHAAWARRAAAHPQVVAALAGREMSESYGRAICQWTDKLPAGCRPAADAILVTAARAGMDLRDLAALAAELYERSRPDLPRMRIRGWGLRTGRCGWRRRSRVRGCWAGT